MGLDLTSDAFWQACTAELLADHLPEGRDDKSIHILVVGNAYAILSALLQRVFPSSTIFLIDIGKTFLFEAHYCQRSNAFRMVTFGVPHRRRLKSNANLSL